jgi:tetratricopeptide (TPR) repeat protein
VSLGARFKEKAEGLHAAQDFDREADQIRRGQAWAAGSTGELPTASKLVITYALTAVDLRDARTSSEERESWIRPALAAAGLEDIASQANLLVNSSWDCADRGQTREALDRINRAIELSEANGLSGTKGLALISRSHLHNIMGRYREALEDLNQGSPLAGGELEQNPRHLANLVNIYQNTGEAGKAIEYGQRDLEAAQAVGDTLREARALGNLGLAYHQLGRYQDALEYHRNAGELARSRADKRGEAANIANAGIACLELRRFAEAEGLFRQALKLAEEISDKAGEEGALGNLGVVFQNTGRHQEAVENFQAAMEVARARGHRAGEASALHGLARVHLDLRNYGKVTEFGGEARRIAHEIGQPHTEAVVLTTLGRAATSEDKFETAVGLLSEGLDLSRTTGQKALEAGMHQNLALALKCVGRREEAVQHAREALAIFRQLGMQTDVQVTELLIERIQPASVGSDVETGGSNLVGLLMEWMKIPAIDVADSKEFLIEHQDVLMTEEAENLLLQMTGRDPENKDNFRHHKLVRECRLKGIEAAYGEYGSHVAARVVFDFDEWRQTSEAEKTIGEIIEWAMIPEPEASRRFLREHSEDLLSVNAVLLLGIFAEKHEDRGRFKVFSELHKRCRKLGIEAGYDGFDTIYWHPARTDLVLTWFRSPTENFLVAHQDELLTDETEVVLELMFEQRPHWSLKVFRDLIRQARIDGIPKALIDFGNASLRYAQAAEQQE